MNLNIVQSLVMGFVSGLAEMLPVSAEAHRGLLRTFFGVESEGALSILLIHLACLVVLAIHNRTELGQLREASKQLRLPPRRRTHQPRLSVANTLRLLKGSVPVVVLLRLLAVPLSSLSERLWVLALVLALNGALLFLPCVVRSGNKDSRNMPRVDGMLMALGAGASAVPGISTVGAAASLGMIRGVDRRYALRFAQHLLMFSLLASCCLDAVMLVMGGLHLETAAIVSAAAGAVCAGVGSWLGLKIVGAINRAGGFANFCYYSWGLALICMALYVFV